MPAWGPHSCALAGFAQWASQLRRRGYERLAGLCKGLFGGSSKLTGSLPSTSHPPRLCPAGVDPVLQWARSGGFSFSPLPAGTEREAAEMGFCRAAELEMNIPLSTDKKLRLL